MSRSTLRLTGTVAMSRYYTERGTHRAVHDILLVQAGNSLPALARRTFDDTPANHMVAERIARQLRPGLRATVHAAGWSFDASRQQLVLAGVDHLEVVFPVLDAAA